MRILIIEDDQKLSEIIKRGLLEIGYAVDTASDGEEGEELAKVVPYDLIVLDIILPKKDRMEVCLRLRQNQVKSRIIILTCKDSVSDRVKGLDSGADDYLVKPFAFDELMVRIRALMRREIINGSHVIRTGKLSIDTLTKEVKRGDERITLIGKEYALLEYFLRNSNIVITRRMIGDPRPGFITF